MSNSIRPYASSAVPTRRARSEDQRVERGGESYVVVRHGHAVATALSEAIDDGDGVAVAITVAELKVGVQLAKGRLIIAATA